MDGLYIQEKSQEAWKGKKGNMSVNGDVCMMTPTIRRSRWRRKRLVLPELEIGPIDI